MTDEEPTRPSPEGPPGDLAADPEERDAGGGRDREGAPAWTLDESSIFETPLVELDAGVAPTVYAKVEWCNLRGAPHGGGSIKTRIGKSMLDAAEARDELDGRTIIEPSSGNTALALARIGAARGYDVEIVTRESAGEGKLRGIREAGADLRVMPADEPYAEKIYRVSETVADAPEEYYWPNQYSNPANPNVHEETTAAELREQAPELTHAVVGVGSGGSVTGLGRGLPEEVTVVGFDPAEELHRVEGLRHAPGTRGDPTGAFDRSQVDVGRTVTTDRAWQAARDLRERYADREVALVDPGQHAPDAVREALRVDGEFVVGPSSGGALAVVEDLVEAGELEGSDSVGILLCDRGDRYTESLWSDLAE